MSGGVGVVTVNDRVFAIPTGLTTRIVNIVAVKYVACAILRIPVLDPMVTPVLVVVYDHVSAPVSDAVFVNAGNAYPPRGDTSMFWPDVGDTVSMTGGAGVVMFIGSVPVLLTAFVAEIVNVVAVKYVAWAIVKRPFESIVTPDVVGEYDHVTVPTSAVLCVN
jgi:hypothetical protein